MFKKRFLRELSYIDPRLLMLMPVAHMLLHGVLKDLMVHAIVSDVDAAMVAQFSPAHRRAVRVRLVPSAMTLLVAVVVLLIVAAQSGYCRIYRKGSLCHTVSPGGIPTSATT